MCRLSASTQLKEPENRFRTHPRGIARELGVNHYDCPAGLSARLVQSLCDMAKCSLRKKRGFQMLSLQIYRSRNWTVRPLFTLLMRETDGPSCSTSLIICLPLFRSQDAVVLAVCVRCFTLLDRDPEWQRFSIYPFQAEGGNHKFSASVVRLNVSNTLKRSRATL